MSYELKKRFTWLWLIWLLAFAVIETIAVISPARGDTLSEHVWRWFDVKPGLGRKPRKILRFLLLAFLSWLGVHLVSGGYL